MGIKFYYRNESLGKDVFIFTDDRTRMLAAAADQHDIYLFTEKDSSSSQYRYMIDLIKRNLPQVGDVLWVPHISGVYPGDKVDCPVIIHVHNVTIRYKQKGDVRNIFRLLSYFSRESDPQIIKSYFHRRREIQKRILVPFEIIESIRDMKYGQQNFVEKLLNGLDKSVSFIKGIVICDYKKYEKFSNNGLYVEVSSQFLSDWLVYTGHDATWKAKRMSKIIEQY